jgi:hypothetical protein
VELARSPDRVPPADDAELAVDAAHVALGGVHRDVQLRADLHEGQHARQVPEHGPFPLAERLDQRRHRGHGHERQVEGSLGKLVQEWPAGVDPVAVARQQFTAWRPGVQEDPSMVFRLGKVDSAPERGCGLVGSVERVAG